jgi:uncharacterized protein (UPF0335 family)
MTAIDSRLSGFIERIEKIQMEIDAARESIKEIFYEMKLYNYDVKLIREIIRLRRLPDEEYALREEKIAVYKQRLHMLKGVVLQQQSLLDEGA